MSFIGEFIAGNFEYHTLKMIHLFGIILFMGNIIITGWWKTLADRTGEPRIIAFAQRQVTLTDFIFTFGGVTILLAAAFGMVYHLDENVMPYIYSERWLNWGYWLFIVSGVIWVTILIPVQYIQAKMAHIFAETGEIPDRYWTLGKIWLVFGILATIIPLANIYWMVMKA